MKYVTVGVSNTALDTVLYLVLTQWLGLGGAKVLAKAVSYGAGVLNSFHWHRSWTFRSPVGARRTFVPFVFASLAALAINAGAMQLGLQLFNQYDPGAFALATTASFLWNFGATKFLVFRS